jgi:hypothetical protein
LLLTLLGAVALVFLIMISGGVDDILTKVLSKVRSVESPAHLRRPHPDAP